MLRPIRSNVAALLTGALFLTACADESTAPGATAAHSSADYAHASSAATHTYQVTITNLTTSQPLSPGVIVTHDNGVSVWEVGEPASEGVRLIAENGDPSVAIAELTGAPGVFQVVNTAEPIHRIGGPGPTSRTFAIGARANANRLSVAVMLICTNDGFTGVSGVKLPGGFKAESYLVAGYDAGTELNTELWPHIVDPCALIGPVPGPADGNGRVATGGVISHHPGILGVGDLSPSAHGWRDPVAQITVQRVK